MLHRRWPVALLCGFSIIVGAVLLAGCSADDSRGLTSAERGVIRSQIQDAHWAFVTTQFPDAPRPEVTVVHTVHDGNWQALMIACLRAKGFTIFVDGRYFQFGTTAGRSPEDFAIVTYECLSRYPTADEAMHYLDRDRLHALYSYYSSSVRPCLLRALTRNTWNPYRQVWDSSLPAARIAFLEQLCPPVPGWLDLAQ